MIRIFARLRSLPERIRFRVYPRLARYKLDRATLHARELQEGQPPLRILVDNTVLDLAITHESRWITTGAVQWGKEVRHTGYQARVPVYSPGNKSEKYRNATYLTGIAHLARVGAIELCQSAELDDERFRQPVGRYRGYGYFDYSLFSGIKMESVDGSAFTTLGPSWMKLPSPEQQQRTRLAQSDDRLFHDLYALLREQLGKKCDQDAWHIRTAERHGAFCFLTTDRPLLLACKSLSKKEPLRSLRTKIMSPADLGSYLAIRPVPPHLLTYNDASWFVRMDHTMPEQRRRRRSEYQ
jgi:hypothetical protein